MRIWIRKKAIGAQIEPGIGYLSGLAKYPENTWILKLSDTFHPPLMANTPGVFDRTGDPFHLNGAPIEVSRQSGAGKCPDSGCSELGIDGGFWEGFRDGKEDGKCLRSCW